MKLFSIYSFWGANNYHQIISTFILRLVMFRGEESPLKTPLFSFFMGMPQASPKDKERGVVGDSSPTSYQYHNEVCLDLIVKIGLKNILKT